jgi:hypothetical protein
MGLLLERFGTQEFEWHVNGRRVDPSSEAVSADMTVELRPLVDLRSPSPDPQSGSQSSAAEATERSSPIESAPDMTMALVPIDDPHPPPPLDVQPAGQSAAEAANWHHTPVEFVIDDRLGARPVTNYRSPTPLAIQPPGQPPADETPEPSEQLEFIMDERVALSPRNEFDSPPPLAVRRSSRRRPAANTDGASSSRRRRAENNTEVVLSSPKVNKRKQHAEVEARYRRSMDMAYERLGQAVYDGRSSRSARFRKGKLLDAASELICKLKTDFGVVCEENKRLHEMLRMAPPNGPADL